MKNDSHSERSERRHEASARIDNILEEAEELLAAIKIDLLKEHQEICEQMIRKLQADDGDDCDIMRLF